MLGITGEGPSSFFVTRTRTQGRGWNEDRSHRSQTRSLLGLLVIFNLEDSDDVALIQRYRVVRTEVREKELQLP
jgi:hypothetical protein